MDLNTTDCPDSGPIEPIGYCMIDITRSHSVH